MFVLVVAVALYMTLSGDKERANKVTKRAYQVMRYHDNRADGGCCRAKRCTRDYERRRGRLIAVGYVIPRLSTYTVSSDAKVQIHLDTTCNSAETYVGLYHLNRTN